MDSDDLEFLSQTSQGSCDIPPKWARVQSSGEGVEKGRWRKDSGEERGRVEDTSPSDEGERGCGEKRERGCGEERERGRGEEREREEERGRGDDCGEGCERRLCEECSEMDPGVVLPTLPSTAPTPDPATKLDLVMEEIR